MINFVHLHLHTEYSLLDGACRIDKVIKHAKDLGQKAIAITDHGVMYGAINFYKEAKKQGIKPIIGCEAYIARRTRFDREQAFDARPHHLVLLCKNETGYNNLMKLVSEAYINGFYSRPRIDKELLERYSEGLIGLSACLAGEIPRLIEIGDYEKAKETALWYKNVFEKDSFYLELMDHGIAMQKSLNTTLVRLSEETGIPLVATNDCHYINKEDAKMQDVLIRIQTKTVVGAEGNFEFATDEFYLKTGEEMLSTFPKNKNAIDNTIKIADMCNLDFTFGEIKLPKFVLPDNKDNNKYFRDMCYKGLKKYYGNNPEQKVIGRLEYEIDSITSMGYVDYFLIVHDFIDYAKRNNIPVGPGRGSGAGSLCAYCVGITGVDPIKYGLIFERFLNPERITMPDFDIDFCYERRQEVIDYVVRKYGSEHVAQIISFGTLAARAAVRDVGRALGISYGEVDKLAKAIPRDLGISLKEAKEKSKELRDIIGSNEKMKELYEMAEKVEGMPRHASTHAAGVVITSKEVNEYVPLALNDEAVVTQYDMDVLEELGLLKIDFLGLRTLTLIKDASDMIRHKDESFDSDKIPLDDKKVFELFSRGETEGIFQFESDGMRRVLERLKPEYFEDLIAVTSLYRPGPMDSIPRYIEARHNINKVKYEHPLLKSMLAETYGIIVYQEQVMEVFRVLAGYSYARADLVRRAMSNKNHEVMEKERYNFIHGLTHKDGTVECVGAISNGVSEKIANNIFNEMSSFASYAFNKSHATAYALISYKTAYLKVNYPKEFIASLLTSILESSTKVTSYINEAELMGIKVLPPDINYSNIGFTVDGDNIRFGLLAIKNLGRGFIEKIIEERELKGKYLSLYDFCLRLAGVGLNKRALESLIKSGAMDSFNNTRRQLILNLEKILRFVSEQARMQAAGQFSLFDTGKSTNVQEFEMKKADEFPLIHKLNYEKEVIGFYISGHPLEQYDDLKRRLRLDDIININPLDSNIKSKYKDNSIVNVFCIINKSKIVVTRKNQNMLFMTVEDLTGSVECIVFPTVLTALSNVIKEENIVYISGRVSINEEEETKIIVTDILTPEDVEKKVAKEPSKSKKNLGLYLKISSKSSSLFEKSMSVLKEYSGYTNVYIYFSDDKVLTKAPKSLKVTISPSLMFELESLLGKENIAIKK